MRKPTRVRMVMLGAAALGFLAGFLPWQQFQMRALGHPMNAFNGRIFPLATWAPLACLAAAVLVGMEMFSDFRLDEQRVGFSTRQIAIACGLLTFLLALGLTRLDLGYEPGPGAYLGLLCGLTLACVGLLEAQQERTAAAAPPRTVDLEALDLFEPPAPAPAASATGGPGASPAPSGPSTTDDPGPAEGPAAVHDDHRPSDLAPRPLDGQQERTAAASTAPPAPEAPVEPSQPTPPTGSRPTITPAAPVVTDWPAPRRPGD